MTTIATESARISNWLKWDIEPGVGYTRQTVTLVVATAGVLKSGTVLGKVSADGKYKVAVETASDGSKVADAILLNEKAFTVGEHKVAVLFKGPAIVGKKGLVLDASYDNDTKKNAVYASLEAKGINVVEQI